MPGYQDYRIPEYQETRIPGYIPGYQVTRIPGYQDNRNSQSSFIVFLMEPPIMIEC